MLVPPQVAREASTATLLRHAVRQVPAEETSTLDDVVACLQGLDDDGKELANLLLDTAEMPLALLFFGRPPAHLLSADSALTVITMAGLRLPDLKIEREYWSAEESLALPMLHTAHRLAVRRCYGGSMSSRKMVGLDEAHFMEGWRSGRSFLVRLARDSRKWNLAALVASQNPQGHPRPRRAEPRLHRLRRPHRRGPGDRLRGAAAAPGPGARRLRGDAGLAVPGGHVVVEPAGLPRVRDARRGRAGAEGTGGRLVRRRAARAPRHHPGGGRRGAPRPSRLSSSDLEV